MAKRIGSKGGDAEEALRGHFLQMGQFAVRSIPFAFRQTSVTDVDIWLYSRGASLHAERTCVDVKRKRTPQAMERILWTKGLVDVLRVDRGVVVTTDNRPDARDFATLHGVTLLQGEFLQFVMQAYRPETRLSEEDLCARLQMPCAVDPKVNWRQWFASAKSGLITDLNFDGCNSLLLKAATLLDEFCAAGGNEPSIRLLYLVTAYLLISVDHASRHCRLLDTRRRQAILADGFRYGEAGQRRTEEVVRMAVHLLADQHRKDLFSEQALREEFENQVTGFPAETLGEFFAKPEVLKSLVKIACAFESLGYASELVSPKNIPGHCKAVLGMLCDFFGHDRRHFI